MRIRGPSCATNEARCAMTALLAVVRCDCGGELQHGSEQTPRGLRWTFTCTRCGSRWGHRDGVFGPLDRAPIAGQLAPLEAELLALFRRLPQAAQQEIVAAARARV
jgi:hypothetical protein